MCLWARADIEDKERSTCSIVLVTKVVLVLLVRLPHLVSVRLECRMHVYLFIDCSIDNGLVAVCWRSGE